MKSSSRALALSGACWVLISASPAWADCTDAPGSDVYWRRCVFDRQPLAGLDLTNAIIRDSSFKRADLTETDLTDADGRQAKFVTATMQRAILDGANLVRADMTKADLRGASLIGADLTQARLFQADFSGANLTEARLNGTDMLQAIFDGATWIDGATICAEGSIGRCLPDRKKSKAAEPDVSDAAEPPA